MYTHTIDCVSLGVLTNTVAINRGVPEAAESWKRPGRILPQSLWRERKPADTIISAQRNWLQTPGLQNSERIGFCCPKPPGLQSFVRAATGKEHGQCKQCSRKYPSHTQGCYSGMDFREWHHRGRVCVSLFYRSCQVAFWKDLAVHLFPAWMNVYPDPTGSLSGGHEWSFWLCRSEKSRVAALFLEVCLLESGEFRIFAQRSLHLWIAHLGSLPVFFLGCFSLPYPFVVVAI